jgi:hypothetical protein
MKNRGHMNKRQGYRKSVMTITLLAALTISAGSVFITSAYAEDSIDVQCYARDDASAAISMRMMMNIVTTMQAGRFKDEWLRQ